MGASRLTYLRRKFNFLDNSYIFGNFEKICGGGGVVPFGLNIAPPMGAHAWSMHVYTGNVLACTCLGFMQDFSLPKHLSC